MNIDPQPVNVGIIGGAGYTGMELLRLLASHPRANITTITSREEAGKNVTDLFPSLRGNCAPRSSRGQALVFTDPAESDLATCDLVFSATPSGVAMTHARSLLESNVKLIDLSADFRLRDVAVWEQWYGRRHACPDLVDKAVYGLPEVHRESIKTARLVANPGCYPTAIQLGFLPLIENRLIDVTTLIADAKSGVSGAGRGADRKISFCEVADSFKAYCASGHRHLPEIKQGLQQVSDDPVELVFIPHLLPMIRGIHGTLYARLSKQGAALGIDRIHQIFIERYQHEPFVDVLEPGSHPDTRSVRGSNHCRLSIHRPQDGDTIVVLAVEDNLVKGAAGQAIQNMNLMSEFEETTGLSSIALVP